MEKGVRAGFLGSVASIVVALAVVMASAAVLPDRASAAGATSGACPEQGPGQDSGRPGKILGVIGLRPPASCHVQAAALAPRSGGSSSLMDLYGSADPTLRINGGVVMGTDAQPGAVTLAPIFWTPPGYSLSPDYTGGITAFGTNLEIDPSWTSNVFAVGTQYTDHRNRRLAYSFDNLPPLTLSSSWSASCTPDGGAVYHDGSGYRSCITDRQIMAGVERAVSDAGLPADLAHLYAAVLPQGVEVCTGRRNSSQGGSCTTSSAEQGSGFCAYHSSHTVSASHVLTYVVLPYPVVDSPTGLSCNLLDDSPAKNLDLDVGLSQYSHEIAEAITDPTGNGWHDSSRHENGDLCSYAFGSLAGKLGRRYNHKIAGVKYLLQQEFSNLAFSRDPWQGCQGGWSPPQPAVAVAGRPKVGKLLTFTASVSLPLAPLDSVSWTIDGQPAGTEKQISTTFTTPGIHRVSVAATDTYGFSGSSSMDLGIAVPKR